jgi:gliding motility-associated-like protein
MAYYPFNGNANDESGHENHGVEFFGGVSFADGKFGQAAKFAGYDNPGHIKVSNSPSLQFLSEASFAAWVRLDDSVGMDGWGNYSMNGNYSIIAKDHDRNGYFELVSYRYINTLETVAGHNYLTMVKDSHEVNDYSIADWIHITYVFSDSTSSIYINGMIDSTSHAVANFANSNQCDLYFGKFSDYWYPFNGALDEVRIYNRALTAEEVACLYNGDCNALNLSARVTENNLCRGSNTSIQIMNAQPWVSYQLIESNLEYGSSLIGNNDILTFPMNDLLETTSFTILATDTATGCSIILDSIFVVNVNDIIARAVIEMPSDIIPVTVDAISQSQGAQTFEWYLDGVKFSEVSESQFTIDSTGVHELILNVTSGPPSYCMDADTVVFTTLENIDVIIEIPSSFTPNKDGINDYFEITTERISKYDVWIKDSWSSLIYEFDNSTGKWDGLTQSGNEALDGPYYYNFEGQDYIGQSHKKSGVVYLIRELIELSPNPAKDKLDIKMKGRLPGKRTLSIISVNGSLAQEQNLPYSDVYQIDITNLKRGIYQLVISNGIDSQSISFIKE